MFIVVVCYQFLWPSLIRMLTFMPYINLLVFFSFLECCLCCCIILAGCTLLVLLMLSCQRLMPNTKGLSITLQNVERLDANSLFNQLKHSCKFFSTLIETLLGWRTWGIVLFFNEMAVLLVLDSEKTFMGTCCDYNDKIAHASLYTSDGTRSSKNVRHTKIPVTCFYWLCWALNPVLTYAVCTAHQKSVQL